MINNLSSTHLLGIKYLTTSDINLIFKTADNFKKIINQPIKKVPSLRDITIANLFFENDTWALIHRGIVNHQITGQPCNIRLPW